MISGLIAPGVSDGLGRSEAKAGNERDRAMMVATNERVNFMKSVESTIMPSQF